MPSPLVARLGASRAVYVSLYPTPCWAFGIKIIGTILHTPARKSASYQGVTAQVAPIAGSLFFHPPRLLRAYHRASVSARDYKATTYQESEVGLGQ